MDILLVDKPISRQQLKEVAKEIYGDFVKAVIDVEKGIMAINGELHADQENVSTGTKFTAGQSLGCQLVPGSRIAGNDRV